MASSLYGNTMKKEIHHAKCPKVPDYKIYKVEDIPELMGVKRALAAQGLKDPWLRNEVWKYDVRIRGTQKEIFRRILGRGLVLGFGLAVLTTIAGRLMTGSWDGVDRRHHPHVHPDYVHDDPDYKLVTKFRWI